MLGIALAAALSAGRPNAASPALAGEAFQAFVRDARSGCPQADVAHLTPAGLLNLEEAFLPRLSARQSRRLEAALPRSKSGGLKACADRDGASCTALAYLEGFRRIGVSPNFVRFACASSAGT